MAEKMMNPLTLMKSALQARVSDYRAMLPPGTSPERFVRTALIALAKNPYLMSPDIDRNSLFVALQEACRLGLEIGDRGMHLVPFKGKVQAIPDWKGLCTLAKRAKNGPRLVARVVRDGDRFDIHEGTDPKIDHQPRYDGQDRQPLGVYAVATFPDKSYDFEYMEWWEVSEIRERALATKKNKDQTPWTTDPIEMGKKTVLKRLCKRLDISPEFNEVVEKDNAVETDAPIIDVDADIQAEEAPAAQPTVSKVREAISKAAQKPQTFEIKKPAERQPGDDGDDVPNFQDIP